ncbi:MAG: hypothetical protein AAF654_12925 [Myxococcota bacterium]
MRGRFSPTGLFPKPEDNATAGHGDYDYGVVRLDELFAAVLFKPEDIVLTPEQERQISDEERANSNPQRRSPT